MRAIWKLGLGLGLVSFAAWSMPACGGSSDSGSGGSKATGGKGGTGGTGATGGTAGSGTGATGGTGASGGTGATGGSGGSGAVDAGHVDCQSSSCDGYVISLFGFTYPIAPCCAGSAQDKCGVEIDSTVAGFLNIPSGCVEENQAGALDSACPNLSFGETISFPGCCNAATSTCGYQVDLGPLSGPSLGCADTSQIPDASTQACGQDGGSGGSAGAGGSAGSAGSTSDASTD